MKVVGKTKRKSIFRAIFVPMIFVMILQVASFYCVAVYGGVKQSLDQNAADILNEQLINKKTELENMFNSKWTNLKNTQDKLTSLYNDYEEQYGDKPFCKNQDVRTEYINYMATDLVSMLRQNGVNGVFLILNDEAQREEYHQDESKSGLCIRDLDQTTAYTDNEDLLIEKSPSSTINIVNAALDSWWESKYTFKSEESGDYFYKPLNAAYENAGVEGDSIAYISSMHSISESDAKVMSYSIPIMDKSGYPFAVLGVEIMQKYINTLLPNIDSNNSQSDSCYLFAMENSKDNSYITMANSGVMYDRCFINGEPINVKPDDVLGGFEIVGRDGTEIYGDKAYLNVYDHNNPFEKNKIVVLSMSDKSSLFDYSRKIQHNLIWVAFVALVIGVLAMLFISRKFASPITNLAKKIKGMKPTAGFKLERLGIEEIDQLVDNIETLSRDVSENMARTEFFSRMSHDMRTPMNAIISFSSDELLENADENRKTEYLKQIHNSGAYLLGLINEVLDMTKIDSKKAQLHMKAEKVDELFDTTTEIIQKLAQKKNINFVKQFKFDDRLCIMCDKQHLNQVIMNLLSNAVKFTPQNGTVTFVANLDKNETDNNKVDCYFSVSDTGIGMSDEFMSRMYTPFEQENSGKEGTGLGLSIGKSLVELMGGKIECQSKKNMGTTFDVNVSFDSVSADKVVTETEVVTISVDDILKGKKILLCEDHPINTQIALRLLERKGIIVCTAENGQIGVDKFSQSEDKEFDAVLMDIKMPVMNGLEAAKAIRAIDRPDAKTIPIIAMTANAFAEDVQASKDAGMNAHLSKPIEPDKLYETLAEKLKKD